MHTMPNNALSIIIERAKRTTNIAIAKTFLEQAIHPAEIEIWKDRVEYILNEQAVMRAEECRNRQVAKERWDKAERGSEQEYIWAIRYLELTNGVLKEEILGCTDIATALLGWKTTEKTEPAASVWRRKLDELEESAAQAKADSCADYREAAVEFKSAEPDSKISMIWFARYITLRYQ